MKISQILNEQIDIKHDENTDPFQQAGLIHKSELESTLNKLSDLIKMPKIKDSLLGSAGKKEFSGDIDIGIPVENKNSMVKMLEKKFKNIRKTGGIVSVMMPIQGYSSDIACEGLRTGSVQIDFMFEDPEWLKFYFYSPSQEESKYKGAHRNLAIAALARHIDKNISEDIDAYGRPTEEERYIFSPKNGLHRIKKSSMQHEGKTLKTLHVESISEPIKNPIEISKILFGTKSTKPFTSLESIIEAIEKKYDSEFAKTVYETMALYFKDAKLTEGWTFPEQIQQYLGNHG